MAVAYLIGDPVAHSLSPAMQNAAFGALGLPHRYELLRVRSEDLRGAIARIREDDVLGANVTIPHKEKVARALDGVEETARRIGAVNTLFKRTGSLRGDNTDGPGFGDALAEKGVDVAGRRVLLLGAGGAARACVDHLTRAGAQVTIAARTAARARHLAGDTSPWPVRSLEGYEIVVNATSLGLRGEDPLEDVPLLSGLAVVDVVATARETPLMARARAGGCVAVDGLIMLLHQGARAFRLWTGLDAPVGVMRAALPRAV
ncbi:MAG: shikimate dehydrogenase [Chloroflexota bacterium]|nr:shikimate dehydrogenase [Chloroflexota bacterium]MDE3192144.1 shikimate dehydrogenase [Chloroflexota bacterium]